MSELGSAFSSKQRRQNFVSHVVSSHKSFDLPDLQRPVSLESNSEGQLTQQGSAVTRDRCNSLGSPTCDSSLIETSSIGLVSKSPFVLKASNFNVRPTPFVSSANSPLTIASSLKKQAEAPLPQPTKPTESETNVKQESEVTTEQVEKTVESDSSEAEEKLFDQICDQPDPPKTCVRQTSILTTILQPPEMSLTKTITVDMSQMNLTSGTVNGDSITVEVPSLPLVQPVAVPEAKASQDPFYDPWCDPQHPKKIQFQDISAAAFKIKSGIMVTPCTRSHLSSITGMEIFFKKDFLQYTGSFKERGARYTLLMLPEEQQKQGVIAASAGNHALALSYHGQDLGIPVTVVMPIVAPIMKVQSCRQFGANVIIHGKDIGESKEHAMKIAREKNFTYINGYDHPHIIAGQGTMGLEIVEQVKNIDAVIVPVGGGGLIAGVALAVKSLYPHIQIIGVESERCTSFGNALRARQPIYTKADSTLADGLAVPKVGVNALETALPLVDKCIAVKEEYIAMSILRLVEVEKAVVEGAGACGLAAILAGLLPELKGKRVVVCLCGGNIDTTVLGRCLERGLAVDGRLVKFSVTVSDRPGGIAELCRLLASMGVSIKDILHERAWLKSDIFSVEVRVMCETRDLEHAIELERVLKENYNSVHFGTACDIGSGYLNDMFSSHTPMHT